MSPTKKRNHPHADLIRQWLDDDSLKIECKEAGSSHWLTVENPLWSPNLDYRAKVNTPVYEYKILYKIGCNYIVSTSYYATRPEFDNAYLSSPSEHVIQFVSIVEDSERIRQL